MLKSQLSQLEVDRHNLKAEVDALESSRRQMSEQLDLQQQQRQQQRTDLKRAESFEDIDHLQQRVSRSEAF